MADLDLSVSPQRTVPPGPPPPSTTPAWFERRAVLLFGLVLTASVLFAATYFINTRFEVRRRALGEYWFKKGQAEMAARTGNAVEDFRNALAYSDGDNFQYRLRLAQALSLSGRADEAIAYLESLWEREPGNGTVNLELARLKARQHQVADALRFFHGAIYGIWDDDPEQHRRIARFELVQFLLQQGSRTQAESELVALTPEATAPDLQLRVAGLFVQVHDFRRAMQLYNRALRSDGSDPEALKGAGEAAYNLGQYAAAARYLEAAVHHGVQDPATTQMLQVSDLMRQLDPYEPRLSGRTRAQRVIAILAQVGLRLRDCAAASAQTLPGDSSGAWLQQAYKRWLDVSKAATEHHLMRDEDLIDSTLNTAFDIDRQVSANCATKAPVDTALALLSRERDQAEP